MKNKEEKPFFMDFKENMENNIDFYKNLLYNLIVLGTDKSLWCVSLFCINISI